jgi:hypothetical protein
MVKVLEIDGKKLHSIKAATSLVSYSADYITRLAREEKIIASHIGRQWYVDVESLKHYESIKVLEQTIRKQNLSDERKRERAVATEVEKSKLVRHKNIRAQALRTKVVVASALVAGLFGGYILENSLLQIANPNVQVASTKVASTLALLATDVEPAPEVVTTLAITDEVDRDISTPTFVSQEATIASFAESSQGVLLLPATLTEGELLQIKDLFSDRIVVRTDSTGQKFVSQVNEYSEIIGSEIPVIVLPVNVATP